jgi:hypothetical protein
MPPSSARSPPITTRKICSITASRNRLFQLDQSVAGELHQVFVFPNQFLEATLEVGEGHLVGLVKFGCEQSGSVVVDLLKKIEDGPVCVQL